MSNKRQSVFTNAFNQARQDEKILYQAKREALKRSEIKREQIISQSKDPIEQMIIIGNQKNIEINDQAYNYIHNEGFLYLKSIKKRIHRKVTYMTEEISFDKYDGRNLLDEIPQEKPENMYWKKLGSEEKSVLFESLLNYERYKYIIEAQQFSVNESNLISQIEQEISRKLVSHSKFGTTLDNLNKWKEYKSDTCGGDDEESLRKPCVQYTDQELDALSQKHLIINYALIQLLDATQMQFDDKVLKNKSKLTIQQRSDMDNMTRDERRKKRRYEKYYEKLETDDLPRDISKMGEQILESDDEELQITTSSDELEQIDQIMTKEPSKIEFMTEFTMDEDQMNIDDSQQNTQVYTEQQKMQDRHYIQKWFTHIMKNCVQKQKSLEIVQKILKETEKYEENRFKESQQQSANQLVQNLDFIYEKKENNEEINIEALLRAKRLLQKLKVQKQTEQEKLKQIVPEKNENLFAKKVFKAKKNIKIDIEELIDHTDQQNQENQNDHSTNQNQNHIEKTKQSKSVERIRNQQNDKKQSKSISRNRSRSNSRRKKKYKKYSKSRSQSRSPKRIDIKKQHKRRSPSRESRHHKSHKKTYDKTRSYSSSESRSIHQRSSSRQKKKDDKKRK